MAENCLSSFFSNAKHIQTECQWITTYGYTYAIVELSYRWRGVLWFWVIDLPCTGGRLWTLSLPPWNLNIAPGRTQGTNFWERFTKYSTARIKPPSEINHLKEKTRNALSSVVNVYTTIRTPMEIRPFPTIHHQAFHPLFNALPFFTRAPSHTRNRIDKPLVLANDHFSACVRANHYFFLFARVNKWAPMLVLCVAPLE